MRRSERKTLDPDLGMLTARLLFRVQHELTASLPEREHTDLKPKHGAILAYLDAEGSRATDLARFSGQHKQVIGTLVDELVELGYVRREPDPADRRAKLIVPTDRGLAEMRASDAILERIEQRYADAIGAAEFAQFKATLRRIASATPVE
ncbi:transcriptional regulator, MarR family [Agromyces sp. CF514]|uniref:MarR family winged helix-turn-helix transcriptional regulator n=1 Tax=Agromyces sp. CF514 TaxID=1881031 RepID=UPI0008E2AC24|nr:MarR family transcriptional regulator [Agromyces sp. CF514]SFR69037.1 transcriptional regulator, MarR family [Agromyces sp. CF514]